MAVLSFESGRAHDAVAALERSVEAPGATVDDAIRAADLCIREGAIEAGETMFSQLAESALHASAAKIALARLRAAQGGAAYRAGDDRAAIAAYERALDADPRNVAASRDYGWALWRTGDWKGVRRVWTAYAAAYPERPEPYELLGRLELHEGQPLRAIEQAQKALAAGGDTLGPNMLMTRAFLANAQYQRARRLAEEVASAHPGDLVAQTLYAEALWRTLDFRASAGQWRKVMDMGFDTPRATHYWLRSLYETGDADGAIAAAEKVFDSGKASEPVIRLLAEDALVRGDDAATIRWYGELTQRYPQRAAYWIALVDAYRQAGRRRDEGRAVKEALKLHPETTELLVADAEFQLVKRRPAKALERYRALTDRYGPTYATFDGELRALRAAGREDEALILLRAEGPAYLDADDLALSEASILEALGRRGEADAVRGRVVSRRGGAVELPILLYHGIADHPRTLNVPLDRFERQMRAVRDAGYTPITIAELDAMLAGRASFPGRPIAVTFDDARGDSFRYGDPILARLGMKATMFVPTVRVADESAFNADWATLKRLAGTGRWDFQAHGHLAHDPIAVDGEGGLAEFLVNRAWLPEQERMETHEEFAARVERDYDICRARLLENLPGQAVVGYAFPFSEMGQLHGGNDAKALAVNESAFGKRYRYGFLQDSSGYNTLTPGRRGPVILRRLNVPRDWDAERLMAHLASESPAQRARLAGAEAALANAEYAEAERALRGMIAENPRSYPTAGLVLARDLQEQGRVREAERAYRLVPSGPGWDRPDAERRELARDLAWETDPQAGAEVRVVSDSDERDVFQALATARYPLEAPVDFWGSAGSVQFRDAVFDTLAGFQGTLGMAWIGASRTTAGGWLRGRSLGSGVQTVSGQASVRAGLDRHRFGAACGVTDVETVGALMDAVQSRGCDGAYDVTGRRWRARTRIAYGDLTDGNAILYGWADGTVALPWMRDLSVGGRLEAGDSRTASPLYYAPAGLITAIGLVRYARAFPGGARLEAEGGIGPSRDERVSSRMVGRARVAWTQDWGLSWRSTVVGEYGETADYRRTTLSLAFGYRF
jgi:peptidoglycan/xylan/chitin deacetylase (PgdA/CDA1 family)/Tfp pilus assembly protein PilF